jgi:hypothetical protein
VAKKVAAEIQFNGIRGAMGGGKEEWTPIGGIAWGSA